SGLGGEPEVAGDPRPLYREAAARTMALLESDDDPLRDDIVRLLDRYDNRYDRLVELLTEMLANRDQWLGHLLDLRKASGFDRPGLEQSLRILVRAQLSALQKDLPEGLLAGMLPILRYNLEHAPKDEAELRALLEAAESPRGGGMELPTGDEALGHWQTLANRLLTATGASWRKQFQADLGFPPRGNGTGEEKARRQGWKDRMTEQMALVQDLDELRERLHRIRKLPGSAYRDADWESLQSMMQVLIRAAAEWTLVMAENGVADFVEIAGRAGDALGPEQQPSDLALRLDYRIRHLLVDEFQDTSHSQIRLLERLTAGWSPGDGHTLFLVGDPMQSIYRFRKAEVSLFIKAFEGTLLPGIGLERLRLSVNFRSARPLIDWANRVFPAIMPLQSDPVMGAVPYSPSRARPGVAGEGGVSFHCAPGRDDDEEARRVLDIVSAAGPEERVAILVRSRKHAREILAELDRRKETDPRFRYRAIDFNPLAEAPHVVDLVSLTLALQQPADRLAWLSVLRAPFVGLDLDDLERLAGAGGSATLPKRLQSALEDKQGSGVSPSGRARLDRAGPILLDAARNRGRAPLRSRVESAWNALGGPACLGGAGELADCLTFFDLLDALVRGDIPIDRDVLGEHLGTLYAEPDPLAGECLQVMTIYGAKGLEFDTVILPGLNRETGKGESRLMHWFELAGEDRIVLSPMTATAERKSKGKDGDLVRFIADVDRQRQALEDGRLLYVAATRAVERLHLFISAPPGANGEVKPKTGTLLQPLWPAIRDEWAPILQEAAEAGEPGTQGRPDDRESPDRLPRLIRRLPADWRAPQLPPSAHGPGALPPESIEAIEFRWAGEDARHSGILVHRLLQHVGETGLERFEARGGMDARRDWCRWRLLSAGIRGKRGERVIERVSRAVEACLASQWGRWILGEHPESQCELALTALIDDRPRNLVIDRSFVFRGER
ncbi:MAG: UvrD-helicase domain-containing protein, partial [Gammaproteobacteria bacterium]|nr:UvrD-helicase domain-containing protein [Gammaproteobacteria bacterium]